MYIILGTADTTYFQLHYHRYGHVNISKSFVWIRRSANSIFNTLKKFYCTRMKPPPTTGISPTSVMNRKGHHRPKHVSRMKFNWLADYRRIVMINPMLNLTICWRMSHCIWFKHIYRKILGGWRWERSSWKMNIFLLNMAMITN